MTIFHNATVYTGDGFTDAFAVDGGRFAAIGADALALAGERIDLGGDPFQTDPARIQDIPVLQTWIDGARVW